MACPIPYGSHKKLKPGLVASYDIPPGNGEGLFWFWRFINLSLPSLIRHVLTYSPEPLWGAGTPYTNPQIQRNYPRTLKILYKIMQDMSLRGIYIPTFRKIDISGTHTHTHPWIDGDEI